MDIAKNLRQIMKKQKISISALERKAGVTVGSVQNILYKRSKNPGIETLLNISKALQTPLYVLIASTEDDISPTLQKTSAPWDINLYADAVIVVKNLILNNDLSLNQREFLECVNKIYEYSQKSLKDKIDLTFAEWTIEEKKAKKT